MDRLIKLDELMKYPIRLDHYDKEHGNKHFVFGVESVLEYAEYLPTVDAAPVVHGEWNICEDDYNDLVYHTCSNCGAEYTTDYGVDLTWKYCPNCGSKMDGGKKDEM